MPALPMNAGSTVCSRGSEPGTNRTAGGRSNATTSGAARGAGATATPGAPCGGVTDVPHPSIRTTHAARAATVLPTMLSPPRKDAVLDQDERGGAPLTSADTFGRTHVQRPRRAGQAAR